MNRLLSTLILLIVLINTGLAQESNANTIGDSSDIAILPTGFVLPGYPTSASDPCFDIDSVQTNCIPVYISVNVHFFLNDDCTGMLATASGEVIDLSPENAFNVAEQLVNSANEYFKIMSDNTLGLNYQWNAAENNVPVTEAQCIPFRYVLKGTRIHCKSSKQNIGTYYSHISDFILNNGSEINVFISNIDGSANGFSSVNSNYIATELVTGNWGAHVFNHEIAHALNLYHSFDKYDGCDDTWWHYWEWDSDCNGTFDKWGYNCWNTINVIDTLDLCNITNICAGGVIHPCCSDSLKNNNLMSYSTWANQSQYTALTPCQINRMLTNLATFKCDFIQVGGCPPPSAFVGIVPKPVNSNNCNACFYLNSSYNESSYEMDILRPDGSKIVSTGQLSGQAGKYCINPKYDKWGNPYWPNGFVSGITYTIKLKVYNVCNESDETIYTFTLPPLCPPIIYEPNDTLKELIIVSITPNPTTSYVTVKYTTNTIGQMKVYGMNLNTYSAYGIVRNTYETIGEEQEFTLDVSGWPSGVNALVFEYNGELYFEQLVKN